MERTRVNEGTRRTSVNENTRQAADRYMTSLKEKLRFKNGGSPATHLTLFCCVGFLASAHASEFTRTSSFDSVAAFVAAAKAFRPAESKTDLARFFTIAEMGQPDDPKTGRPVVPETLDSCEAIWEGATHALVFAVATPKTQATRSAVGVLFLLSKSHQRWRICDSHRFTATGKYAGVTCELTADAGTGYQLDKEGMRSVVTIKESQGGRGYQYLLSASYAVTANRLERLNLE